MVQKVLEGLRDEAFELARDIGVDGGLRKFVELLLELSSLSRQEIIIIKACAPDAKSFESVAATLVEQYSGPLA